MNSEEVIMTCPLGSKCKEIKDNKQHRCMWYLEIKSMNAVTNQEDIKNECAIAWSPIMMLEVVRSVTGVQAATESFRNEMVKGNNDLIAIVNPLNNMSLLNNN